MVIKDRPGQTTDIEMGTGVKADSQRTYRTSQAKLNQAKKEVEMMLELGVIEESNSPFFFVNYKKVNRSSKFDAYPMPLMKDVIKRIGPAK